MSLAIERSNYGFKAPVGGFCEGDQKCFFKALTDRNEATGLAQIKDLVATGAVDVGKLNTEEDPPLHTVMEYGHFRIGSYLLEKGCCPLDVDAKKRTAFFNIPMNALSKVNERIAFCEEMEKATGLPGSDLWKCVMLKTALRCIPLLHI